MIKDVTAEMPAANFRFFYIFAPGQDNLLQNFLFFFSNLNAAPDHNENLLYFASTFFSLAKRGRESCLGRSGSPWIRGSAYSIN